MDILFVASEATPFIKTGGLADVMGSLPQVLAKNNSVSVVMPLYSQIPEQYVKNFEYIGFFYVDLGMHRQYAGVFKYKIGNVDYYFIDSKMYFDRSKIYGEKDDGERFIFFSKAVVQMLKYLDYKPEIVHSNDWHTGLVPLYIEDFSKGDQFYKGISTIFTIHNIKYQGIFPWEEVKYILGLPWDYYNEEGIKYYDNINMMKAGIVYCNSLTTVSETYAKELEFPYYGEGLNGLISKYSYKMTGIINGIDTDLYNPEEDECVFEKYDIKSLEKKTTNKLELQRELGFKEDENIPMFTMVTRLVDLKGIDLILHIFDEFMEEDIQFIILGTGEEAYERAFREKAEKYPKKVSSRLYFSVIDSSKIYAAGDFFIMPSLAEPCGLSQMIAMRYGNIPIVRFTGGLKDSVTPYNPVTKKGDGLGFNNINAHELLFTIKKAIELYKSGDYINMVKSSMSKDFSWEKSAKKYLELYNRIVV